MEANDLGVNSINNVTALRNEDGFVTVTPKPGKSSSRVAQPRGALHDARNYSEKWSMKMGLDKTPQLNSAYRLINIHTAAAL